jgi:hypothetical protein
MSGQTTAVIFEGGTAPQHWVEEGMASVRQAVVIDTINKLTQVDEIDEIILVTNFVDLAEKAINAGAAAWPQPAAAFHFGTVLQGVVAARKPDCVLYMGGASSPLITPAEIASVVAEVKSHPGLVYTNNPQSADIVAWAPADALLSVNPPAMDNLLANVLAEEAGLHKQFWPHSVGVHVDLDTPTDVAMLAISPRCGKRTRKAVGALGWEKLLPLRQAKEVMAVPYSEITLMGRVNPQTVTEVNQNLRCRLRVYSEERGMKALSRAEQGRVRSLTARLYELLGPDHFFAELGSLADAVFIDTRVWMAHFGLKLTERERFLSDLYRVDEITDPTLRTFTSAAAAVSYPLLLGGHSLVTGGMWEMTDTILWETQHPETPGAVQIADAGEGRFRVGITVCELKRQFPRLRVLAAGPRHEHRINVPDSYVLQAGDQVFFVEV